MSNSVYIHEFSTGIQAETKADGSWVSVGFTSHGEYTNLTFPQIPDSVKTAINNHGFALTNGEKPLPDYPTIIGRVIPGNFPWSVIVFITSCKDNKGRSLLVSRYFLCEGDNHLDTLLAWIKHYREQYGQFPIFDPFMNIKQPHKWQFFPPVVSQIEIPAKFNNNSFPILIHPEQLGTLHLEEINAWATKKAQATNRPISWVYNAHVLKNPHKFLIIHTANNGIYEYLEKESQQKPQQSFLWQVDEDADKKAIKKLINQSTAQKKAVKTLANNLVYDNIEEEYWQKILDRQGANKALKQKIYSPQMVRLLTLKAILCPETLLEFLRWINYPDSPKKRQENQAVSSSFISQVFQVFPQDKWSDLQAKLADIAYWIVKKLLTHEITVKEVIWLLEAEENLRQQIVQSVTHDLELIANQFNSSENQFDLAERSFQYGVKIWQLLQEHIEIIGLINERKQPYYLPLANLFDQLSEYKLAAYFYQVSKAQVSATIFFKAFPDKDRDKKEYFLGLFIYRKITTTERLVKVLTFTFPYFASLTIFILAVIIIDYYFSPIIPLKLVTPSRQKEDRSLKKEEILEKTINQEAKENH